MFRALKTTVTINGKSYECEREVEIDGISFKINNAQELTVIVKGDAESISVSNGDVTVEGDVQDSVDVSNGDVRCGAVSGDVEATNGNIHVNGDIHGDVETSIGDIIYKRA